MPKMFALSGSVLLVACLLVTGCGSQPLLDGLVATLPNDTESTDTNPPATDPTDTDSPTDGSQAASLALNVAADFVEPAGQAAPPPPDAGPYPLTAFTPDAYTAAFQRLSAVARDGIVYDWFISETLAGSRVVDFTTADPIEAIGDLPIPPDQVQRLEMVIYYLQLRVPISGQARTIRIYLSDDEVTGEGQHHQGDITEVGADGAEIGWLTAPYFEVSPVRTLAAGAQNAEGGPVSVDPDTGHQRGLFGDLYLWDVAHSEDAWLQLAPIVGTPLEPALLTQAIEDLTVRFNVTNTWIFHDVDGDGQFTPGVDTPGPENHPDDPDFQQATGWAPLLPRLAIQAPAAGVSVELAD